jgi:hypothetical protein
MRQPPSPLLLSARKRRPRRNPPRGLQGDAAGGPVSDSPQQPSADHPAESESCAHVQRDAFDGAHAAPSAPDDEPAASSR